MTGADHGYHGYDGFPVQNEPAGARSTQDKEPGGAMRIQEELGGARRSQMEVRAFVVQNEGARRIAIHDHGTTA